MKHGYMTINSSIPRLTITGEMSAWIDGSELDKKGRTAGWTCGRVNSVWRNFDVKDANITLLCQYMVTRIPSHTHKMAGKDDSGSPVFRLHGSTVTLSDRVWGAADDGSNYFLTL